MTDENSDVLLCKDNKILKQKDRCSHHLMIGNLENAFRFSKTLIEQDLKKECVGLTYFTPSKKHMEDISQIAKQNKKEIICIDAQTLKLCFNPLQHPFGASILFETFKICSKPNLKYVEPLNNLIKQTVSLLTACLEENATVGTMIQFLTDNVYAKSILTQSLELKQYIQKNTNPLISQSERIENEKLISQISEAAHYFDSIYFKDVYEIQSKKRLFIIYLQKLNNNSFLNRLFNSDTSYRLDFVDLLNKDNVVIVNTKNTALGKLNYDFNIMLIQAINASVEPAWCEEGHNLMHFLYIEEPMVYSNPITPLILSKGESFKISCCFFVKNIDQLAQVSQDLKTILIDKICNKFFFKGVNLSTWNYFFKHFETATTYNNTHLQKKTFKEFLRGVTYKRPYISKETFLNLGEHEFIFFIKKEDRLAAPEKSTIL